MKPAFTAAAFALCLLSGPAFALDEHIPRAQLDAMFADMKAHAPWDVNGNLLWGYYFTSVDKVPLQTAADELTGLGYRFVNIYANGTSDGKPVWWLHVERVEHHTADSLDARNQNFYDFADAHPPLKYDGMDVGPVTPAPSAGTPLSKTGR